MSEHKCHSNCFRSCLIRQVPMLKKGIYHFEQESGHVYREHEQKIIGPLRQGLSGYLWLLHFESGYFRKVK